MCVAAASVMCAGDGLDEARAQLSAGKVDSSIQLLRGMLAKDPTVTDASVLLAETLLEQERMDEAEEVVDTALAKNPLDAKLERVEGDVYFREGRIFDADKAYKAALKTDPNNARALYGISRVFEASCLRQRAYTTLRAAHAIDFHDPRIVSAFDATDRGSPPAVARMQAELARYQSEADAKANEVSVNKLKRWIAEAKALDGKPEFELASADPQYRIPFTRLMDGRHLTGASLPIRINDAKADLRFDTGAAGIVLGSRFAERAGIQRLGDTEFRGIGNGPAVKGWVGYAPDIRIGNLEFRNCLVEVAEKGSVDDSGGLIGSNIFRRFLIKINFAGQSLDLNPLPGPAWDGHARVDRYDGPELVGYTQILAIGHDLLIPTLVSTTTKGEQTTGLFLFDTGSTLNMISSVLAPDLTKLHGTDMKVHGVSGKVKTVYEVDKIVVQFANFRQQMHDLTSIDLGNVSRSVGAEISGIMGLPLIGLFESVTLDYRDGRIKFDYKR